MLFETVEGGIFERFHAYSVTSVSQYGSEVWLE